MLIESTLRFSETGYVRRLTLNAAGDYTGRIVPCVRVTLERSFGRSSMDSNTPALCCERIPALNSSAETLLRKLVRDNAAKIVSRIQSVHCDAELAHGLAQAAFLDAARETSPIVDSAGFCSRWFELASLFQTRELIARELKFVRSVAVYFSNEQEADDLAQTATLKALQAAGSLKDPRKIHAWLRTIVRNASFDAIRLSKRVPTEVEYDDERMSEEITPDFEKTEILERFDLFIQQLPERDREMIRDYFFDDRKKSEIAGGLEVHRGTMWKKVTRLLTTFREQFTKEWP